MSGFVGILHLDSQTVDPLLLSKLNQSMAGRGPDAQRCWVRDFVGMGHTQLQTTIECQFDQQPAHLEGQFWIVADARIDDRPTLIQILEAHGSPPLHDRPDSELILWAYRVWGEDCVSHLLGDFAFAIWDDGAKKLFCARDRFGIKPFFYSHPGKIFLFSNTLNCLRKHPQVSNRLNDLAIADFLVLERHHTLDATAFADISRLPPAHVLSLRLGSLLQLRQYWTLSLPTPLNYRNPEDYCEQFRAVMRVAVADRMRRDRAGLFLSGGLDSTTLAAFAREVLPQKFYPSPLSTCTGYYDQLIPDEEPHYVQSVVDELELSAHYLNVDSYLPCGWWQDPQFPSPEPRADPFLAISIDSLRYLGRQCRVVLGGYGGDPIQFSSNRYFFTLLRQWRWGQIAQAMLQYSRWHDRLPPVGIRTQLRQWLGRNRSDSPTLPPWLNPGLVRQYSLRERYQGSSPTFTAQSGDRQEVFEGIDPMHWVSLFER
ncbi:MAG: asparagine synthase-related protein, partial [Leptolyngbyaceae cyanobacterium bins.59]|nr:asparagine synthase-related protein [Leptolyngbyaceae cyanobacterium bins.59]